MYSSSHFVAQTQKIEIMQTLIYLVLFYGSELVFHFMRQNTDKHIVKCKLVDRFFPLIQYSCQLTTYYTCMPKSNKMSIHYYCDNYLPQ